MVVMYRLDSISATDGLYSFVTESNSLYQIRIGRDKRTLIRFNSNVELRGDHEELKIIGEFSIVVGELATFILEPLDNSANFTIRRTNIVKRISYIN